MPVHLHLSIRLDLSRATPYPLGYDQREGMGKQEYKAVPSLRDVAHAVFCVHLEIDQP